MAGILKKLTIEAYKEAPDQLIAFPDGGIYEVMFNPATFDQQFGIKWTHVNSAGEALPEPKFDYIPNPSYSLTFTIDGTGVTAGRVEGVRNVRDVTADIALFRLVCGDLNGVSHQPHFLRVVWGTFIYYCRLEDVSVNYSLFRPDGTPLRAKVTAKFIHSEPAGKIAKKLKMSSPDLTHVRTVKNGDTLPLMTQDIYGTPDYYLEVAKFNGLNHFRDLKPGDTISFPPLDKSS